METKADYIAAVVACKLVAVFSAAPLDGPSPLTVTFTDQSQNATAWLWDFGDGSSSTAQNPTHTYTEIGTTTVTLTVMNECGSDTITEEITVTGYNIHIQTITVTEQRWWLFKRSTAAIHVVDSTGRPVADAVVEVMNNQQPMAIYFYYTDADGVASCTSSWSWLGRPFRLCVTDVLKGGWPYDPSANVVTGGSALE